MRVFVYFNLHKKVFSVKAMEGHNKGRVIAHSNHVTLLNATFKVSEAGRQRVLREQRKNVHAGVIGEWVENTEELCKDGVTYNPYKFATFVTVQSFTPVYKASRVILLNTTISADIT